MDAKPLLKRLEGLKNDAATHMARCDRMAPYVAPSRGGILTQRVTPGQNQVQNVYDSTTLMASELMSQFMASNTFDPSQQWMSWAPEDPEVAQDDEAREWCEESRDRCLKELIRSQFYAEGVEAMVDYGGFGTGFLLIEEAPQPVNYIKRDFRGFYVKAEKTGRFYIAEGADGIVNTSFREFESTVDVVYGEYGDNCSEKVRNLYTSGKLDDKVKMVQVSIPRPRGEQTDSISSRGMPWASVWIDVDAKHICRESGTRVFQAAVPRYSKTPGEVMGRGRADIAFGDTWTLNQAKYMGLKDWALKIQPPLMHRHDSIFGTLKLVPGAPMSVNTHGQAIRDVIMPYESGSRPEVSHLKEEELRKSIREIFYVEHILELMRVQKSEMTAYEFQKKLNLLFKILGPVYGRLQREFLFVITEVCFDIMYHAGAFSPPPEILLRNGAIKTVFHNPIAQAQKATDVEILGLVMNDIAPLAQASGTSPAFDWFDVDKTVKGILTNRGYPALWTRGVREVETLRAARQQQQEQQMQLEQAAQYAESAGKVAPFIKTMNEAKVAA